VQSFHFDPWLNNAWLLLVLSRKLWYSLEIKSQEWNPYNFLEPQICSLRMAHTRNYNHRK
jgi:hypothetical protein